MVFDTINDTVPVITSPSITIYKNTDEQSKIEIVNSLGEILPVKKVTALSELKISKELKPGIYLCKIAIPNQVITIKFNAY